MEDERPIPNSLGFVANGGFQIPPPTGMGTYAK